MRFGTIRQQLGKPSTSILLFGVLLIVALLAGAVAVISSRYEDDLAAARRETANLSSALAEETARSFQSVDLLLKGIVEKIRSAGITSPDDYLTGLRNIELYQTLRDSISGVPQLDAVTIIGHDGTLVNFSRYWPIPKVNIADRDYFKALRDNPKLSTFIGEPVQNRGTGTWTIYLARRVNAPDGSFLGLVLGAIELGHFDKLYQVISLGTDGSIALIRRDGKLLGRHPQSGVQIGTMLNNSPVLRALERTDRVTLEATSNFDNERRIMSGTLIPDYPLVVVVTRSKSAVLADWRAQALQLGVGAAVTAMILGLTLLVLFRQMHQRERSERALSESEERYRTVVDNLTEVVFRTDAVGRWTFLNPAWTELSGYPVAQSLGRSSLSCVHPDDHALNMERFRRLVMREEESCAHEVRLVRRDGKVRWCEVFARITLSPEGRVLGSAGTLRDVTERHDAAEALRASETRLSRQSELLGVTFENMSQGIMMVDANRIVQVCNRRVNELLGLPESLTDGKPSFDDILRWQWQAGEFGPQGEDVETWLRSFVLGGGIAEGAQSYERRRPNGMVLEIRSLPLPGGGMVRTYTDITERKRSEEALRAARDEADRAARAKSDFLAMMSHEIRSPLHGLLGIAELLRKTPLDSEQSRMLELLLGSAGTLQGVLDDVLDFSKIEAGAIVIAPEPVKLRAFINSLVEPMGLRAAQKEVALTGTIADEIPDVLMFDRLRVGQILINLLSNAIKFTSKGSIRVAVYGTTLDDGRAALRCSVADSGVGMTEEVLGRLFQPFTQADASTTRNFGGTGLGLSISRRLARLLGGDLTVTSVAGEGSQFVLEIPLVEAPRGTLADAADEAPRQIEGDFRILIAEDQPTNRWLILRQMERLGVKADVVEDGFAAIAAIEQQDYDLLITDCHMPGMEGTTLASHLREREARLGLPRMPIIGLTADITPEMRARCDAAGMDGVETKPMDLRRLSVALHRYLVDRDAAPQEPVTAGASSTAAVFDDSTCRDLFGDAPEAAAEWLQGFLAGAAARLEELRVSASAADAEEVVAAAHALAGTALTAGAIRLGTAARAFEHAALAGTLTPSLLEEVEREFAQAESEISSWISKTPEVVS